MFHDSARKERALSSKPAASLNTFFVTALNNLEIRDLPSSPIEIREGLFLTNHVPLLEKLLQPTHLQPMIGSLEMHTLLSGKPVLVEQTTLDNGTRVQESLIKFLYTVQAFADSFWLQTDCAVDSELAFGVHFGKKGVQVDSNFLAVKYRDSGNASPTISIAIPLLKRSIKDYFARLEPVDEATFGLKTKFSKTATRFQIAVHHLHAARSADTLEMKLASYCSAFEALLSTSTTELSHQLSERISVLLFAEPKPRLECYRQAKRIYGIRSKVVHGSHISSKDQADLQELCKCADNWARSMANFYLKDSSFSELTDSANGEKMDDYFLGLLVHYA